MEDRYCEAPGCERPVFRGALCSAHVKQQQRNRPLTPIAEKLSAERRLLEAAIAWAEAEEDEEYERGRQSVLKLARAYGRNWSEVVREGMRQARERGVHVGRPRKVEPKVARRLVRELGSIAAVASRLGVSWCAVKRALSERTPFGESGRPRPGGD